MKTRHKHNLSTQKLRRYKQTTSASTNSPPPPHDAKNDDMSIHPPLHSSRSPHNNVTPDCNQTYNCRCLNRRFYHTTTTAVDSRSDNRS